MGVESGLAQHFLVVEDDPIIRRAVGRGARGLMEARFAESGQAALEALRQQPLPRFVLLDYMLPDLNGLEVLRRLRADPRCGDLPVLMFSSLEDPARIQQTLQSGADAWVPKPDDPVRLRDLVRSLCIEWGGAQPGLAFPAAPLRRQATGPETGMANGHAASHTESLALPPAPVAAARFRLLWDGRHAADAAGCGPLARDTEAVDETPAGRAGSARRTPGRTRFLPVEVLDFLVHDPAFDAWAAALGDPLRRDLVLQACDDAGAVRHTYRLARCWVSYYEVDPVAEGAAVRGRRMRIEHEGWGRAPAGDAVP